MSVGKLKALTFAVIGAGLLVSAAAAQQSSAPEGFTAEETQRLREGHLVERRITRRRGQLRLIGGSAWQVVDQPAQSTWGALCDEHAYTSILPATEDARVVSHRPGERVMRIRHSAGLVRVQYYLRMTFDHDHRDIAFRLDRQRPNDLRAAWGFIRVQPYEGSPTRSLVSYGVMADPGGGVFGGVLREQIHQWLMQVPHTIRNYMHGRGAHRY